MRDLLTGTFVCLLFYGTTSLIPAHATDKPVIPGQPAILTGDWPVKFTVQQKQPPVVRQAIQIKQPFYPKLNPRAQHLQDALKNDTTVDFPDVPLMKALQEIQKQHGINIFVSGSALKELGITAEEPVNVSLRGVSLKSALKIILEPLGMAYEIDQEVLKITTQAEVDRHMKTRIYPVGDLCSSEKEFLAIQNAILIGCQLQLRARKQRWSAQELELRRPAPAPAPYQTSSNPAMTFVPQCHALVVNETEEIHEKIVELLTQLRQVRQDQAGPVLQKTEQSH
ncbi:DsrE family protein [Gimesia panareensis]|uniref:Secretin/TonB short N-terminal domain-containing protein n=1 Tax=Gimesia panareensis TaxID=2527978 RepID=A0A517Q153_9PLAN|nr:DsrE family protein [Gimesia panareensis]QDT25370.1 hypothetical protein Enr10x_06650 [Gimesia panareensis]QDU48330.1 hypothetical protein Pan110_06430 [Gimesia panareensis]QDV18576.1 hypothetical protein Pan153_32350 [Gimesia panareensis]